MRSAADHRLLGDSACYLPCSVELGEGRKGWVGAAVAIGKDGAGQVHTHGGDVVRAHLQVAETVLQAGGISGHIAVPEIAGDTKDREGIELVAWAQRRQILFEALQVDHRVGRHVFGVAGGKYQVPLRRVDRRHIELRRRSLERDRRAGQSRDVGAEGHGDAAGKKIVLPKVRQHGYDGAAAVDAGLIRRLPVDRNARPPSVQVIVVGWLRVKDKDLVRARVPISRRLSAWSQQAGPRGEVVRFVYGRVHLVAEAVGHAETWRPLPGILKVEVISLALGLLLVDVIALREPG